MKLKIINGTRSDNTSLCEACSHAVIIKGGRQSQVIKKCGWTGNWLNFNVSECSQYYPKNLPSLRALQETAWILSTSKGRVIGFNPPKQKDRDYPDLPIRNPFEND